MTSLDPARLYSAIFTTLVDRGRIELDATTVDHAELARLAEAISIAYEDADDAPPIDFPRPRLVD